LEERYTLERKTRGKGEAFKREVIFWAMVNAGRGMWGRKTYLTRGYVWNPSKHPNSNDFTPEKMKKKGSK